MQALTSAVLAAFVAYAGSWYFGYVEGNFALLLFVASVVTGLYWLAERFYFLPQRQKAAAELEVNDIKRRADLGKMGITEVDGNIAEAKTPYPDAALVAGLDRGFVPRHHCGFLSALVPV